MHSVCGGEGVRDSPVHAEVDCVVLSKQHLHVLVVKTADTIPQVRVCRACGSCVVEHMSCIRHVHIVVDKLYTERLHRNANKQHKQTPNKRLLCCAGPGASTDIPLPRRAVSDG
jgi:hypothetical protein